jgi:hypothetical protein
MVGVERRLPGGLRVEASYAYRTGLHLLRGRNVNAPDANGIRPDPNIGNVTEIRSIGRLSDHLFSVSVNGRSSWHRAFYTARYEFEDEWNDGDGPTSLPADDLSPDEWGPASGSARHELSLFGGLDLVRGVQTAVNLRGGSAPAYNITTGRDDDGDGVVNDRPAGVGRNSARGGEQVRMDLRLTWRLDFGQAPTARGGGEGRGGGRRTEGRAGVELYLRAQNVLNTVNYTGYRGAQTSPFFGEPTSARAARQIEVGTRFRF